MHSILSSVAALLLCAVSAFAQVVTTIEVGPEANLHQLVKDVYSGFTALPGSKATIVCKAGFYSKGVTNLLRNGIDWYGMPGAVISNNSYHCSIWDNSGYGTSGAITSRVEWLGTVIDIGPDDFLDHERGVLVVSNSASRINFKLAEWLGGVDATEYSAICVTDAEDVQFDIDRASASEFNQAGSLSGVFSWKNGRVSRGRVGYAKLLGGYAYWGRGNASADAHVEYGRIEYGAGDVAIFHEPTHIDSAVWVKIGELDNPTGTGVRVHGGKCYVDFQKIKAVQAIRFTNDFSASQLWMRGMKLTRTAHTGYFFDLGGNRSFLDIQEYEDESTNSNAYAAICSAGTNTFQGGSLRTGAIGPAIRIHGGKNVFQSMRINTQAATSTTNYPFYITAGSTTATNLLAYGCTLVSPWSGGGSHAVFSAVASPFLIGGSRANTNASGATAVAGTLDVDPDYGVSAPY